MKIALVHDYLAQDGGAERVLKAFHELWPEAPIFVLFHDKEKITGFNENNIRESFLGRLPFIRSHFPWYLPLMPMATERYPLHQFDVVLSSSSSFAKGVITHPGTLHISYCHTPTRYLWFDANRYLSDLPYNFFIKSMLPPLIHRLRAWDFLSANRVDRFIANSRTVQKRINKYYRRDSDVIHPPVAVENFQLAPVLGDYFVAGGRLVPYKRLDLAIQAFNRLGYPLKIFGAGPELARLRDMAKPNIKFLGRVSDSAKAELFSKALAFIHPQLEDFGITPVEAMASGRPVIAYAQGGAAETIIPGETGLLFYDQSWESLLHAVLNFNPGEWDRQKIRAHASQFSIANFKNAIKNYVENSWEESTSGLRQSALIST